MLNYCTNAISQNSFAILRRFEFTVQDSFNASFLNQILKNINIYCDVYHFTHYKWYIINHSIVIYTIQMKVLLGESMSWLAKSNKGRKFDSPRQVLMHLRLRFFF